MVRYAISKGYLDTELKREWWESPTFQFTAANLYEIFPTLASQFQPNDEVLGGCKADLKGYKFSNYRNNSFLVSIAFECFLDIQKVKIVDFNVGLAV